MLALALSLGAGCQIELEPGELEQLQMQPTRRFPVGSTFYLPVPAEGQWTLARGPEGNDNQVVTGADGYARFTPVMAGEYEFVISGTDERRTMTAVDQVPYEHFNYYQTSSMAMVEGELWVAHLFDPHVSRVDPASGEVTGTIQVGPWPAALAHAADHGVVLVAHKAGDTIGFVDVASGRLVDSLWVGDEPAEIVLSPDGATAYVSLATEDAVVAVDVASREVTGRVAVNVNPTTMAISDDGSALYVASYRSAVSSRQEYGSDERNDQSDLVVVDTESFEVTGAIGNVGATTGGVLFAQGRLYVATTRAVVEELTAEDDMTAFRHSVVAYDPSSLAEVAAVDLGRQPSAAGLAVRPFGMAMGGGTLWVTAEGSDLLVGLDPDSLAERTRISAAGRPRTVLADGDRLFVHGAQAYQVTVAGTDGTVGPVAQLSGDPRPEGVIQGQFLYTGTGEGHGLNHSCADCHVDGLTDGNVWSAGFSKAATRPMFWMEGTGPIGWEGDAYDLYAYLYGSPTPTIGATVTTELHQAFYDYLAALVPPPPANGMTHRDGSPTEDALRGEAVFENEGSCGGCHAGPLKTQGLRLPGGGTHSDYAVVVPSLIGSYRHTFWLVDGAARTLEEAVVAMLPLSGVSLEEGQVADIARYLGELTAREFFVLTSSPLPGIDYAKGEGPLEVTFSHPVFAGADNLDRVTLRTAGGEAVEATVEAEGRYLSVTPVAPLTPGGDYEIAFDPNFEAFDERTLGAEATIPFTVADAPAIRLEGDYVITVHHPNLDRDQDIYDTEVTIPIGLPVTANPTGYGAIFDASVTDVLDAQYDVTIDGDVAHFSTIVIPIPGAGGILNRSFPATLTLVDDDGDGVADGGEGNDMTLRNPGLEADGVRFTIARPSEEPNDCSGQEGDNPVDLMIDAVGNPTIDWDGGNVQALGYFVTDPNAEPPLGPGAVTGGETYWAVSTASFPDGFVGPVVYGELPEGTTDVSANSEAPEGGAELPRGGCVKISVIFTDFTTTTVRYETPAG